MSNENYYKFCSVSKWNEVLFVKEVIFKKISLNLRLEEILVFGVLSF